MLLNTRRQGRRNPAVVPPTPQHNTPPATFQPCFSPHPALRTLLALLVASAGSSSRRQWAEINHQRPNRPRLTVSPASTW